MTIFLQFQKIVQPQPQESLWPSHRCRRKRETGSFLQFEFPDPADEVNCKVIQALESFLSSLLLVTPVWVRRDIYNLNFWWGPLLDKYTFLASHWKYWKNISFATHTRVHQNRVIYPTNYSNNSQQRENLGLGSESRPSINFKISSKHQHLD